MKNVIELNENVELQESDYSYDKKTIDEKKEDNTEINQKYFGKIRVLLYHNKEPLFVLGPNWVLFLGFSISMNLISLLYFYTLWDKIHHILRILSVCVYIIFSISHLLTGFLNSGIPKWDLWIDKNKNLENPRGERICPT